MAQSEGWLFTTWKGGCNNAQADVRGRALAPVGSAAFAHPARVRRLPDGRVEAWWRDDKLVWHLFVARHGRIPEALLEQAQAEAAERMAHP